MRASETYFGLVANACSCKDVLADVRRLESLLPTAQACLELVSEMRQCLTCDDDFAQNVHRLFGAAIALPDVCETLTFDLMHAACAKAPMTVRSNIVRNAVTITAAQDEHEAAHLQLRLTAAETVKMAQWIDPYAFQVALGGSDVGATVPIGKGTEEWALFCSQVAGAIRKPKGRNQRYHLRWPEAEPDRSKLVSRQIGKPDPFDFHTLTDLVDAMEESTISHGIIVTLFGRLRTALMASKASLSSRDPLLVPMEMRH